MMSGRLREKVEEEFRMMAKFLFEAYQTKRPADKIEKSKQVERGACQAKAELDFRHSQ